MGKYTIYNAKSIDNSIQKKLDYIVDRILDYIGKTNIKAIILGGGFGRGEGGVVLHEGMIKLINDFDISIICKYFKYQTTVNDKKSGLQDLAQDLARKVEIKQVDLGISHPARFYFTTNKVGNYEYRNGHKILYGNLNIKKKMKAIKAEKLPITDGTQYFLTRGSGFLIPAVYFYKNNNINEEDRENFLIETNKAILSMGDSYLLMQKKYHFSYQVRLNRIYNINFSQAPNAYEIKRLYKNALQWKLKPNLNWQGDEKEIGRWFYIRNFFKEYFLWYENKRLNCNYSSWNEYMGKIYDKQDEFGVHFVKKILNVISSRNKRNNFSAKLSIMPGLLFSLNKYNSIDHKLLELCKVNMNKYYNIVISNNEWPTLVKKYLNIFHPGGVVNKIIKRGI